MLVRRMALRPCVRSYARLATKKISSPSVAEREVDTPDTTVIPDRYKYPKPGTFTRTPDELLPGDNSILGLERPAPLASTLLHDFPLWHSKTHGHKVCDLILSSFTKDSLEPYWLFVGRACFYLGIPITFGAPMPHKVKRWTVNRSPFVHSNSKQNFERVTYRRKFHLYDTNPETIEVLLAVLKLRPRSAVGVHAIHYTQESIDDIMALAQTVDNSAQSEPQLSETSPEVIKAAMEILKDPGMGLSEEEVAEIETASKA